MFRTLVQRKRIELIALLLVIAGVIAYAVAGIVYAGARIASADVALNSVVSHQNTLNATFTDINTQLGALNNNSSFKPQDAVALVDKSVSNSELATSTISADDASLRSALSGLDDYKWLTMVGRGNLDREAARIGHARNALAAARIVAVDKVLEGKFWHALYTGLGDLAVLNTQSSSGDLASARTTLGTMTSDIDQAAAQSSAPPLPLELSSLMKDLQAFVADYGKQLDAQIAGDDASVTTYQASVQADLARVGQYDFDAIGKKIVAFYKPMIERFNTEIAAATA
jgi:hypothetical protein